MRPWIALFVVVVSLLLAGTALSVGGGELDWVGRVMCGLGIVGGGVGGLSLKRRRARVLRADAAEGVEAQMVTQVQSSVFLDAVVIGTVVACLCVVAPAPMNGALIAFALVVFMIADFGARAGLARLRERQRV